MSDTAPVEDQKQQVRRYIRLELGRREPQDVPIGNMLSYGTNGSPTITITKTLFSATDVTSTKSTSLSTGGSISLNTGLTTNAAFARPNEVSTSKTTSHTPSTTSNADDGSGAGAPPGKVAGATLGSMAAVGVVGFFIWFFCLKKKGKKKSLKATFNFGRRKSSPSSPKTPQLENQSMEQTRSIMLRKSLQEKNRSNLTLPGIPTVPDIPMGREKSMTESAATRPSWIGLAVSSSTPLHTPPLPRSHSQKSTNTAQSVQAAHPSTGHPLSFMPRLGSTPQPQPQPQQSTSSLMPAPLKPVMRKPVVTPAPIITSLQLATYEKVSPLSLRGMFDALGHHTKGARKRASQILSPSSIYNIGKQEGQGGFEFLGKDGSLKADESEGMGTGKESLEKKGSLFGRRSRSSTRADSKVWTGQWI